MIRKEARAGLTLAVAKMARTHVRQVDPDSKVDLIEQDDGLWTFAAEWEDGVPPVGHPAAGVGGMTHSQAPLAKLAPAAQATAHHAAAAPTQAAAPAITVDLLQAAVPSHDSTYYQSIAPLLSASARSYAIDRPLRIAHFLSQIGHESGFRIREEDGSYSAPRMHEIFGCKGGSTNYDDASGDCRKGRLREKLWTEEARYAHNARNLLSYVYANRFGNGDEASQDGFRYCGRGLIQLTFKDNYAAFTKAHNARQPGDPQDFVQHPELVSTDLRYGIEVAFYFWDALALNKLADQDDAVALTLKINGGLNGLAGRRERLARVKKVLGI